MRRRRNRKTKSKCQEMHAKKRAFQRFGMYLNTETLIKEIQENKLQFIESQSNRVTVWRKIDKEDELDIVIIYDKKRKQVVTVMPYNMYVLPSQQGEKNVQEEDQKQERKTT